MDSVMATTSTGTCRPYRVASKVSPRPIVEASERAGVRATGTTMGAARGASAATPSVSLCTGAKATPGPTVSVAGTGVGSLTRQASAVGSTMGRGG